MIAFIAPEKENAIRPIALSTRRYVSWVILLILESFLLF